MTRLFSSSRSSTLPIVLFACMLNACAPSRQSMISDINTIPVYPINPAPGLLLLVNTYDIRSEKLRDNKEELFLTLADSILVEMSRQISSRSSIPTKVVYGLSKTPLPGDVRSLLAEHNATHSIAMTFYDVKLVQTDVVTATDGEYKSKEAYYDIVSDINYTLYDQKGPLKDMQIAASRYHSSRSVLSGLLAAGPNIVNNKEEAMAVTRDNVEKYLNFFLPGKAERYRTIFVGDKLSKVNAAYLLGDYGTALKESLLYINDPDKKLAAKANLNCAVFLEHQQKYTVARSYIEKSLQLYPLPEARTMMTDYGVQE